MDSNFPPDLTRNIFITGGAGVGKSYLLRETIDRLRADGKTVVALAATGIAALNIGAMTVHRFFLFAACKNLAELAQRDKTKYNRRELPKLLELLKIVDAIAIDEISMIGADLMDMIDFRLRQGSFSGKMILCGDFYQLPPVRKETKNVSQTLFNGGFYAFESDLWRQLELKTVELTEPKRTQEAEFIHLLNSLRVGKMESGGERLIRRYAAQTEVLSLDPTHLYGRNAEADTYNHRCLERLKGDPVCFEAQIEVAEGVDKNIAETMLKSMNTPALLMLKIGARVLFTVNSRNDFYNGERGIVTDIQDDMIAVEKDNQETVLLDRYSFTIEGMIGEAAQTLVTIRQFPIRLAWAITIHKSQGMSLAPLSVNIDHIFETGQLYVALS
ncbi:MAG: AAA family ATPase, partial [Helicobacteraceae bacterium]|nr:AAA family ATPase [Helicobacteraceae bacterium]